MFLPANHILDWTVMTNIVKTLVATPDPQKWQEVLPIWMLDMLDLYSFPDWRNYFSHADYSSELHDDYYVVWFKLPKGLGLASDRFSRRESELIYAFRTNTPVSFGKIVGVANGEL